MLTLERLLAVAGMMRDERDGAVELHDAVAGDSSWSLGCRIYSRTIARITKETLSTPWLRVLPESQALRFTFTIGSLPVKIYKGEPVGIPSRSLKQSFAELKQLKLAFFADGVVGSRLLRLAVEADESGKTTAVTLVEVDQAGYPARLFEIPLDAQNIIPMRPKPINLAPPEIEIIEDTTREAKREEAGDKSGTAGGTQP